MRLDPETCYRALRSNDARFDGRFFAAVKTTGIYCRPTCRARAPLRENIMFFPSAAAAEQAGFRACRRCRPDAAPGSPEWNGNSAIVSRGLRMICEGALDNGHGVAAFSARLGVGERHLLRLFVEHLGASPRAVARTRRVHFARSLIEGTASPVAEIALGAGFGSLRTFNASFRRAFGIAPTALRRSSRRRASGSEITLELSYRPPLDWDALLAFLSLRATPGVERVADGTYSRTVSDGRHAGIIEVAPGRGTSSLRLTTSLPLSRGLLRMVERVRRLCDLGADPQSIASHLGRDARLRRTLERRPGLRVPGAWDGFELAVRAILGQQVSVKGATTLAGRIAGACGTPLPARHARQGLTTLFPTARALARADLEGIGMPGTRARAIRALASAVDCGELDLDTSADPERTRERLCALPGVGPWTAEYIAMRALGQPDAFPDGDLGLRKAASTDGRPLHASELARRAEAWRPWRAYAAMALWQETRSEP